MTTLPESATKTLRSEMPKNGESKTLTYIDSLTTSLSVINIIRTNTQKIELVINHIYSEGSLYRDEYIISTSPNLTRFEILKNDRYSDKRKGFCHYHHHHFQTMDLNLTEESETDNPNTKTGFPMLISQENATDWLGDCLNRYAQYQKNRQPDSRTL